MMIFMQVVLTYLVAPLVLPGLNVLNALDSGYLHSRSRHKEFLFHMSSYVANSELFERGSR